MEDGPEWVFGQRTSDFENMEIRLLLLLVSSSFRRLKYNDNLPKPFCVVPTLVDFKYGRWATRPYVPVPTLIPDVCGFGTGL